MFKLIIFPFGMFDGDEKTLSSSDYSKLQGIANCIANTHSVCILNPFGTVLYHRASILNLEKGGKKH